MVFAGKNGNFWHFSVWGRQVERDRERNKEHDRADD
jgi:hypothetical protein